jgi:hypothetical protein
MILDVNKIQEGECLAWVSSPVRTLAVWTSFNKAVKTKLNFDPIYIGNDIQLAFNIRQIYPKDFVR